LCLVSEGLWFLVERWPTPVLFLEHLDNVGGICVESTKSKLPVEESVEWARLSGILHVHLTEGTWEWEIKVRTRDQQHL
jgi:hypothetical protein